MRIRISIFLTMIVFVNSASARQRSLPSDFPSPSFPWVLTVNGKIHTGTISRLTEDELFFTDPAQTLPRSEIAAILFVPPIDPIAVRRFHARYLRTAPKEHDVILLTNGDRFSGRILGYSQRKMTLHIPGLNEPITIPMRRIRAVNFTPHGSLRRQASPGTAGVPPAPGFVSVSPTLLCTKMRCKRCPTAHWQARCLRSQGASVFPKHLIA